MKKLLHQPLFVAIMTVIFGVSLCLIAARYFDFWIQKEDVLLVFIGGLATFIVVGNYMQVQDIRNEMNTKIKKIDYLEKEIENSESVKKMCWLASRDAEDRMKSYMQEILHNDYATLSDYYKNEKKKENEENEENEELSFLYFLMKLKNSDILSPCFLKSETLISRYTETDFSKFQHSNEFYSKIISNIKNNDSVKNSLQEFINEKTPSKMQSVADHFNPS